MGHSRQRSLSGGPGAPSSTPGHRQAKCCAQATSHRAPYPLSGPAGFSAPPQPWAPKFPPGAKVSSESTAVSPFRPILAPELQLQAIRRLEEPIPGPSNGFRLLRGPYSSVYPGARPRQRGHCGGSCGVIKLVMGVRGRGVNAADGGRGGSSPARDCFLIGFRYPRRWGRHPFPGGRVRAGMRSSGERCQETGEH